MATRDETTHEDDIWIYGKTYVQYVKDGEWEEYNGTWCRLKSKLWISLPPQQLLEQHLNIKTEKRRSTDLEAFFDGNINGWYYLSVASDGTDEAIKWILGPIAAHLNETSKTFAEIRTSFPADYLYCFIEYLKTNKFEKGFSKEIFHEFLINGIQFEDDVRLTGYQSLDKIISNPKYKAVATDELDAIIDSIIVANPDNTSKAKTEPKIIQWFVGQVMKAAKGKATGEVVLNKLKEKLL